MKLNEIRAGTLGGVLCSIWTSINIGEIFQTVVLALVGTLVSYGSSCLLQKMRKK